MNVILLSGGSGRRLWPLSNDVLSKQFLKLLRDSRGAKESMVQRVVRQLTEVNKNVNLFVSCNFTQNDILCHQLEGIEPILEPSRRDTFPALSLAAAYLHYKKEADLEQAILLCPIDVFAESEYFKLLKNVWKLAANNDYNIGLLGATPTYPSEKFGYILCKGGAVEGFIEKPPEREAKQFISNGALWNCGVIAVKIRYVLECAKKYISFDGYEDFYNQYNKLPKVSFDYEIVEKESSIGVVSYSGTWKDLGDWNAFTEEIGDTCIGNVIVSDGAVNTNVINMLNIPVIAHDIENSIVVASHDGILVSSKQTSFPIKSLVEQTSLRPMYEQRQWGDCYVLYYKQTDNASLTVKLIRMDIGRTICFEPHNEQGNVWVVVCGKGILTINEEVSTVSKGCVIDIECGVRHSLQAVTELELVEVRIEADEL